jgi:hypothetical protein
MPNNNTIENIIGDTGNDRLTGNALNNTLTGGAGNDQLIPNPVLKREGDEVMLLTPSRTWIL